MGDNGVLSAAEKLTEKGVGIPYAGGFTIDKDGKMILPGNSNSNSVRNPLDEAKRLDGSLNIYASAGGQSFENNTNVSGGVSTTSSPTNKILSREELDRLNKSVEDLNQYVDQSINDLNVVLKSFNNEAIVNSFYASGNYGSDIQGKVESLLSALQKYNNVIYTGSDNLIDQTKKYIQRQIELNDTGK